MKVERPKLVSEVVLERLRDDIVKAEFALGEKISEGLLVERYGVTKAPIRSAYIRLQAEGLIDVKAQSGTYVFKPTPLELQSLCDLRLALELEAARLALLRSPDELLNQITDVCEQMQAALHKGDQRQYQRLDTSFHLVFFDLSESEKLRETYMSQVSSAFAALRHRFATLQPHNHSSISEHILIRDLIAANDSKGLQKLLRQHIKSTEGYYEKLLGLD